MTALVYILWMPFLFSTVIKATDLRAKRWISRGSCVDHHKCSQWLDFQDLYYSCQIDKNREKCPKSCKLCPTQPPTTTHEPTTTTPPTTTMNQQPTTDDCHDSYQGCGHLVFQGRCSYDADYMVIWCKRSCGWCTTITTTTSSSTDCVDDNPACPSWITTCLTNSSVRKLCKKTCNLCPTSQPPTTTATTTTTAPTTTTTTTTAPTTMSTTNAPTTTTTTITTPTTTTPSTTITTTTITTTNTAPATTARTTVFPTNGTTVATPTTPNNVKNKSTTVTGIGSTDRRSTRKPGRVTSATEPITGRTTTQKDTTTSTSSNVIAAGPQYAKKGINKTLLISITISCVLLIGCVLLAGFMYKRRRNKRNDALIGPPQSNVISMQPFNYNDLKSHDTKRDSGIDYDIYDDPYANQRPHNIVQKSDVYTEPSNEQPFYHVLEKPNHTPAKSEPVYACATSGANENKAFQSEPIIYDYTTPEGIVTSLRPVSDVSTASMDTPYYHVLENPDAGRIYQALIPPVARHEYQPIIRRDPPMYEQLQNRSSTASE